MKTLKVGLSDNSYPVIVGDGAINRLVSVINSLELHRNLFIVTDKNVMNHWGKEIKDLFNSGYSKKYFYTFSASEKSKSWSELNKIYSALLTNKFGRDTLMIAIGGGITGDLAGFAASTYMRGIQLVHIPTTLTAVIDSSIGGKTGINFNYYKNLLGAFYQPEAVICDIKFLSTLPKIEMNSGAGELVKYGFITHSSFYNLLLKSLPQILSGDNSSIEKIIYGAISFKSAVVANDTFELGLRKVLNFGHTFAHAFERELRNQVKHGEAVTAGIACALFLSYKKSLISQKTLDEYLQLPRMIKLNSNLRNMNLSRVYNNMLLDKKNKRGAINFVLIKRVGEVILEVNASKSEIFYALNSGIKSLNFR